MSEYIEAQQAAADALGRLRICVTLMVHCPSKLQAPEGVLLTTYDQLHSQISKSETTAYAFPSFGAAQSVMRNLHFTQQSVFSYMSVTPIPAQEKLLLKYLTPATNI